MTRMQNTLPVGGDDRTPPATKEDAVVEILHGVDVADPFRWLEDQESPETRAWIDAQIAYTHTRLADWPGRNALKDRVSTLLKIDAVGTPVACNGVYLFSKRLADQDLPVIYRRKGRAGVDEVLIDPHSLSADGRTTVSIADVTRDGALLAYSVRHGGEDETEIRLLDLETLQDLPDRLARARYFGISLKADGSGFYYTRHEEVGPRVYYHPMGGAPDQDKFIFGEGYGPEKILFAELALNGHWLVFTVFHGSAAVRTEIYYQDVRANGPILPVVNDIEARFMGQIADDTLYIQTNWNAPNGRVLAVDLPNVGRDRWREILPESEAVLEHVSTAGGRLYASTLENVISRLRVYLPDGSPAGEVELPTLGAVSGMSGWWDSDEAFFSFSSFPIPPTIYRYDIPSGRREVWARLEVPIDADRFEVRQVWYTSKDGARIPMFLVHLKGLEMDGERPTMLTGYGGFNASLTPSFTTRGVIWAEQGGVYAVPNLRGGGEFGEAWHRAGMQEKKQNVFDDFHAAAEWLIANRVTNPSKLAIAGGSNGGLLVGAALTQRPELFQAVVCAVPLLDMVRYHRFLVASFWVPEYGSSDDPAQFRTLFAYSPYHRVVPGTRYPAVLFVTGDADTRVAPLHARKMTALLQSATGSDRPILLHYDVNSGHVGAEPISKTIEDQTDQQAFLFQQLGVDYRTPA